MLKLEILNKQHKYYKYIISTLDEFIENNNIIPLNILISNLELLYYRYRDAMFEDIEDYTSLKKAYLNKDVDKLQDMRNIFTTKMNLLSY